jgi:hypothetical protein
MRRLGVAGAIALLAAGLLASPVVSHATMDAGWASPLVNAWENPSCIARGKIWHQELGDSGINRLRAKFELRGQYDTTGIPLLTYGDTGWMYSKPFPDDARSLYVTWTMALRYAYGHIFSGWAILIGERPSFWQRDRKLTFRLGEMACIGPPGTL